MNDIDDWLNSLGLDTAAHNIAQNLANYNGDIPPEPPAPEVSSESFSTDDFNEILAENGFVEETHEEPFDEAEEVTDEENTEENVQAESEDAIYFHMHDGNVVTVPVVHAEAISTPEEPIHVGQGILEQIEEMAQPSVSLNDAENYLHSLAPADIVDVSVDAERHEPPLPPNSPTLLIDNATSRFSGTEWYNEILKSRIILAGIGGIGSNCAFQIARMAPAALFMYDDDIVEIANMSGQLYSRNDVGKAKVDAIADMVRDYTSTRNIYAIRDKFTSSSEAGNIMICGFDNMEARKTFFNSWKNHVMSLPEEARKKCLYLDGRLSINVLQVFCITGDDSYNMERYEEDYFFADSEAEGEVCSLKQTTYLACMIGSIMVNLFTNFIADTLNPIMPYDLPFFTEYDAQNMIFKTIK